jgi:uncharacterized protein (TIGR02466 family)
MNIESVFSNFLAAGELDIDNKVVENYCYKVTKDVDKKTTVYFTGQEPELKELFTEIMHRVKSIHDGLGFADNTHQSFYNSWVNVNENPYAYVPHVHNDCPGMVFSGVYYVKAGEDANFIEFKNPNPLVGYMLFPKMLKEYNSFNSSVMRIKPRTGHLLIFPSWLAHNIVPAEKIEDRISIAFNTVIRFRSENE